MNPTRMAVYLSICRKMYNFAQRDFTARRSSSLSIWASEDDYAEDGAGMRWPGIKLIKPGKDGVMRTWGRESEVIKLPLEDIIHCDWEIILVKCIWTDDDRQSRQWWWWWLFFGVCNS